MRHAFKALILLFLATSSPAAAVAQDGALVKPTSDVFREVVAVDEAGSKVTHLEPVSSARPGEVLTFLIRYSNEGDEEAKDIVLTNPVPQHMVYEGQSARGEGTTISFSVDGGISYDTPDSLMAAGEDGKVRRAMPSDYTHIRWQLVNPVPARGGGTVSFRARVK